MTPQQLCDAVRTALERAAREEPEPQGLVHREEVLGVLVRAATDDAFVAELCYKGADALERYELTGPEKLTILIGDIHWIESQAGPLANTQRRWLEQRLSAEIW